MSQAAPIVLRRAYLAGAVLCVGLPLALQAGLGPLIPAGQAPAGETLQQIGYTFTGLSAVALVLAAQRCRRARAAGASTPRAVREMGFAALLILCCAGFGCLYWALGGRGVERHARTFLALSPVGFLIFVPRPSRWASAPGQSRPR
jgi:hypothetical protein